MHGSEPRSIWRRSKKICTSRSSQKNLLSHKWSKGVVRQSREVRSHLQKQPLSEDRRVGQQRCQLDFLADRNAPSQNEAISVAAQKLLSGCERCRSLDISVLFGLSCTVFFFFRQILPSSSSIYSDASHTVGVRTRLGWVLFHT